MISEQDLGSLQQVSVQDLHKRSPGKIESSWQDLCKRSLGKISHITCGIGRDILSIHEPAMPTVDLQWGRLHFRSFPKCWLWNLMMGKIDKKLNPRIHICCHGTSSNAMRWWGKNSADLFLHFSRCQKWLTNGTQMRIHVKDIAKGW